MTATIEDDAEATGEAPEPIKVIGLVEDQPKEGAEKEKAKEPREPVFKGWVFVATALDHYDDPCVKRNGP